MNTNNDHGPKPNPDFSPAKHAALEAAQQARREAAAAARKLLEVPEGFRSVEHLLDSARETTGRVFGGQADLARYLNAGTKSVSRWLRKEKFPRQETLNAIAQWMRNKKAGL